MHSTLLCLDIGKLRAAHRWGNLSYVRCIESLKEELGGLHLTFNNSHIVNGLTTSHH